MVGLSANEKEVVTQNQVQRFLHFHPIRLFNPFSSSKGG
jgi:hypothetical protein